MVAETNVLQDVKAVVDVDLVPQGKRRWTLEQQQMIAAQSFAAGTSPATVARLHGINRTQIYAWRKALRAAKTDEEIERFAKVLPTPKPISRPAVTCPLGLIEIVLFDGTTVRVDASIDAHALRRVLAALRG